MQYTVVAGRYFKSSRGQEKKKLSRSQAELIF